MIKKWFILSIKLLWIMIWLHSAGAQETLFVEGEHFRKNFIPAKDVSKLNSYINEVTSPNNDSVIMVFFNYGCYGCWLFHRDLTNWAKTTNQHINIKYYPVSFNDPWYKLAQLYYVNQELNLYSDQEIFNAIHGESRKALWLEQEVVDFYSSKNILKDDVLKLLHSFDIARKSNNAKEIARICNINVTPNVILKFKHNLYLTNLNMVSNVDTLLKVIAYLIKFNP